MDLLPWHACGAPLLLLQEGLLLHSFSLRTGLAERPCVLAAGAASLLARPHACWRTRMYTQAGASPAPSFQPLPCLTAPHPTNPPPPPSTAGSRRAGTSTARPTRGPATPRCSTAGSTSRQSLPCPGSLAPYRVEWEGGNRTNHQPLGHAVSQTQPAGCSLGWGRP